MMRYMGGKFRQSKAIVQCLKPHFNDSTVYVEPFCGGMWSAVRVMRELNPKESILNDTNKPLMLLWEKCINEGCDWLPIESEEIEREYPKYKVTQNENDPLTAWYGVALSFGSKWFGGVARHSKGRKEESYEAERKSMYSKVNTLRTHTHTFINGSYEDMNIPNEAVVYCDPPYEGRTKAHHFNNFDYQEFWKWTRDLSKRCTVFVSCFDCPNDFEIVYDWGDTVVRHRASKGSDGTREKLVRWKGENNASKEG